MNFHKLSLKLSSTKSNKLKTKKSNTNRENLNAKMEDSISGHDDTFYAKIQKDTNVLLDINIESPPCTMYGITTNSTGALLSGILNIIVLDEESSNVANDRELIKINSVYLKFVQKVSFSRPFKNSSEPICSCKECGSKELELIHWDILPPGKPTIVTKGSYSYPFSQLLSGKLPQTCKINNKTGVSYELRASLKYVKIADAAQKAEKEVLIVLPIQVTHSILKGNDKNSVRIFPPTSIKATCTLPSVVYPKSSFPMELRLEGISQGNKRWRMRSLNWKIEERIKMRQSACKNHKNSLKMIESEERERIKKEKQMSVNQQRIKAGRTNVSQKKSGLNGSIVNNIIIDDNFDELFTVPISTLDADSDNTGGHNDANTGGHNDANTGEHNDVTGAETGTNVPENHVNVSRSIPANTSYNLYSNQIPALSNLDPSSDFRGLVHPSDYQLRQELIRQQQNQRQWQIEQEKNKDCSLYTEEIRVLKQNTIKSGWKSDFDAPLNHSKDDHETSSNSCGAIEMVTDIDCMSLSSGIFAIKKAASTQFAQDIQKYIQYVDKRPSKLTCDVEDPILGLYVSHILVVEIVVAEEILQQYNGAPIVNGLKKVDSNNSSVAVKNTKVVTVPTGAARVLRMQFRLNFTERSGMGIPWNDEVPPFYEDIKYLSPPDYVNAVAKTLDYKDLILKMSNRQPEETHLLTEHISESNEAKKEEVEETANEYENTVFPVESINGNVLGSADMMLSPTNSTTRFSASNLASVFNSTQ